MKSKTKTSDWWRTHIAWINKQYSFSDSEGESIKCQTDILSCHNADMIILALKANFKNFTELPSFNRFWVVD